MAHGALTRVRSITPEAKDERRQNILGCASLIISRKGVGGCTFSEISETCGFSVGMIQHYYRHRDLLIRATIKYRVEASLAEWQRIYERGQNPLVRIRDLLTFAVEGETSFEDAWGFWLQMYAAAHKEPAIRAPIAKMLASWRALFKQALEEAVEKGFVSPNIDAQHLTVVMLAVIDGLAIHALNNIYETTPAKMVETLHKFTAHELGIELNELLHAETAHVGVVGAASHRKE